MWYTNGTDNVYLTSSKSIPDGFSRGRSVPRTTSENTHKHCNTCLTSKPLSEFQSAGWSTLSNGERIQRHKAACKPCFNKNGRDAYHERMDDLGLEWKCVLCGYNKIKSALDFHHLDPNKKEFAIRGRRKAPKELLHVEVEKCILVCSNCHREIHDDIKNMCREFGWNPKDYIFRPIE